MWSSVKVAVPPTVRLPGLARAALTRSSIVLYGDSVRTESMSSSIATIIRIVIASRWSPGRRPSILPEASIGVAPATGFASPFFLMRELEPIPPAPPARLLTFIGTGDHLFSSMMPVIMRIRLSVPPPGAYGTTTSTVLCGYFACATATADAAASTAPTTSLCIESLLLRAMVASRKRPKAKPHGRTTLRAARRRRVRHLQPAAGAQRAHLRDVRAPGRDLRPSQRRSLDPRDPHHRRGRQGVRRRHRHLAVPHLRQGRRRARLRGAHRPRHERDRGLPRAHDRRDQRRLHRRRREHRRVLRPAHRLAQHEVRLPRGTHARQLPVAAEL